MDWCAFRRYDITQVVNGVPTGTDILYLVDHAHWAVSSRSWTQQEYLELALAGGALAVEPLSVVTINVNPCTPLLLSCPVLPPAGLTQLPLRVERILNLSLSSPVPITTTSIESTTFEFFLDAVFPVEPAAVVASAPVRCDSLASNRYLGGCVDPQVVPTYVLSSAKYPKIAQYVSSAIASSPALAHLKRTTDSSIINANRDAACKGFKKRDDTDSCDEYPFASTYHPGVVAITEHVPLSQNTAQGGNLGGFYVANRLINLDPFTVKVS